MQEQQTTRCHTIELMFSSGSQEKVTVTVSDTILFSYITSTLQNLVKGGIIDTIDSDTKLNTLNQFLRVYLIIGSEYPDLGYRLYNSLLLDNWKPFSANQQIDSNYTVTQHYGLEKQLPS